MSRRIAAYLLAFMLLVSVTAGLALVTLDLHQRQMEAR